MSSIQRRVARFAIAAVLLAMFPAPVAARTASIEGGGHLSAGLASRGCFVDHTETLILPPGVGAISVSVSVDAACNLIVERRSSPRAAASGGKFAAPLASLARTCIAKNWLVHNNYPDTWRTRVESAVSFNYTGSLVADVFGMEGLRQAGWTYFMVSQTFTGAPNPWQVPWYGYNQWSTDSHNVADFNDWYGFHHRQTTIAYGYGNGTCSGGFGYYGNMGGDEHYVFNVYTQ